MDSNGKPIKRKQTTLRRSLGGARKDDDSEDDFKPGKTAKARKAPQSKPATSTAAKRKVAGDSSGVKLAPKKVAPSKTEDDSDIEVVGAAAKKFSKSMDSESDSDIEMAHIAVDKGKGKAQAPKRKK